MIMSKMIVKWLEWIIEIGIWLTLIGAFLGGWSYGDGFFAGLISAIGATIGAGIFCALLFGAFIVLMDIRTGVNKIVDSKNAPD